MDKGFIAYWIVIIAFLLGGAVLWYFYSQEPDKVSDKGSAVVGAEKDNEQKIKYGVGAGLLSAVGVLLIIVPLFMSYYATKPMPQS